jgi:tyrosinase
MATRKNYRQLTSAERDRFVGALGEVKTSGIVDQFARMHSAHFGHGIHRSSHFLPWHREFLVRLERELQKRHADITIPYWDSSVDQSDSDPLWGPEFLGQFDAAWNLRRVLGDVTLPTPAEVRLNQDKSNYDGFWRELEAVIHNPPHRWVGGVMASAASPGDPVFFLHHGWIDLLWAKWQLAHPGAPFVASGPGLGMSDPLMEWPDRTPTDVLDHHRLGYDYDFEV